MPNRLATLGAPLVAAMMAMAQGCGGDFDPGSRVSNLRVLAVRADAPYAAPSESVHLEALAVDPDGRALTWGWGLCFNPASPSAPGCLAELDPSTVVIAREKSTFEFVLPSDIIATLPPATRAHASVGAVVVA